jgi:hypothetical protein
MSIEAMKQALEALEDIFGKQKVDVGAINALRQAIAEAEKQKPVAFRNTETGDFCTGGFLRRDWAKWQPLYAAPVHASDMSQERVDETAKDQHEFAEMVKKGTKAWADTPDGWVDDLRGGVEKQEPVDWDLSNSATVERARKVVKLITGRNQNVWSETDRETVHAINALVNFAVMQFHRANRWNEFGQAIEAKLKEKNT